MTITKSNQIAVIPPERIQSKIFLLRGKKIMFDRDLAALYGVATKRLNEQIKRNRSRFPADFMFQLTPTEYKNLRSHFATSSYGGRRYLPFAFTEPGVAMLSSVLTSEIAIQVNIHIMRTFIQLRHFLGSHEQLRNRLNALEQKYDAQLKAVFDVIEELLHPAVQPKKTIGFH